MTEMYIVLASDQNYAQHAGVVMASLLENATNRKSLTIHFLDHGVSPASLLKLQDIVAKYQAKFIVHDMKNQTFNDLAVGQHISRATYCRLAIGDILSSEVDKAIYLDTDIIIRHDIEELWNTDISNYYAGAVLDIGIGKKKLTVMPKIDMLPTDPYFNAGILLINLVKWRKDHIGEKVISYLKERKDLPFYDQDGLNAVLQGKWISIHPKWNVYKGIFHKYYRFKRMEILTNEFIEAAQDPYIVHFTGRFKPWHYACASPYTQDYYKYLAMTPWKDYHPTDINLNSIGKRLKWILKRKVVDLLI